MMAELLLLLPLIQKLVGRRLVHMLLLQLMMMMMLGLASKRAAAVADSWRPPKART